MPSQEPVFSFIMPAYKARFLRELVIVDDASPEEKKYPEVSLLRAWTQSIDERGNISGIDIKCAEYMNVWDFILVSSHISAGIGNYAFKKEQLLMYCQYLQLFIKIMQYQGENIINCFFSI